MLWLGGLGWSLTGKRSVMKYLDKRKEILKIMPTLELDKQVSFLNELRIILSELSPFKSEPIDCIQWVKTDDVAANDYNPNSVAPPEMEL